MIHQNLLLILSLLLAVIILTAISQRLKVSYPIFLVMAGLCISLVPGMPHVEIRPELVFLIFLPPLLYEAAWFTSWYEFWKWRRPISMLAFGLVFFTSLVVAYISSSFIPGFTLAMGFLLGGIISPPDAVAASSVLKGVRAPKRAMTILEGESLVNDASSLIVFRFALAAIITGQFVFKQAIMEFFVVTAMGIATGLVVASVILAIHRLLKASAAVDITLTLLSPYIMYVVAEEFHFSGVMAVVSGGLFMSFREHKFLNYNARIQALGVWTTLIYILNGFVFILIGLQLPVITEGLEGYSIGEAIRYGIIITAVIILIRIIWVFPATYAPRLLSKKIRSTESRPPWQAVFLVSWSGMRGVVSLASALSIPLVLSDGSAFPHRNLILFITFIVILITLVFQGLTLPFLIRKLNIVETDRREPEEKQEMAIQSRLSQLAVKYLDEHYKVEMNTNDLLKRIKLFHQNNASMTDEKMQQLGRSEEDQEPLRLATRVRLELIELNRKELINIRSEKIYEDEVLRKQELQLDYEEAKLR